MLDFIAWWGIIVTLTLGTVLAIYFVADFLENRNA